MLSSGGFHSDPVAVDRSAYRDASQSGSDEPETALLEARSAVAALAGGAVFTECTTRILAGCHFGANAAREL